MPEKILVVDDDERVRKLVVMYLEKEGYIVDESSDGKLGLEKLMTGSYDCALLDINLPNMLGTKILREARNTKKTPIIMVSANADEQTKISAFEMGADDYVIKPFSPRELVLRVKALLTRSRQNISYSPELSVKDVLVYYDLIIDINSHKVIVAGEEINLTPKEFELLNFLVRSPERVFSRNDLLKAVWNYDVYGDLRTVDTHIKRIRKKLEKHSEGVARMIVTVWGSGYMFDSSKF